MCGAVCGGVEKKWNWLWNWWEQILYRVACLKMEKTTTNHRKTGWNFLHSLYAAFYVRCVAAAIFAAAISRCRHLKRNIYWFVFCSSLLADIWITFYRFYDDFWFSTFLAMDIERCAVGDTDCIIRVSNAFVQVNGKSKFRDFQSIFHFQSNVFSMIQ